MQRFSIYIYIDTFVSVPTHETEIQILPLDMLLCLECDVVCLANVVCLCVPCKKNSEFNKFDIMMVIKVCEEDMQRNRKWKEKKWNEWAEHFQAFSKHQAQNRSIESMALQCVRLTTLFISMYISFYRLFGLSVHYIDEDSTQHSNTKRIN